MMIKLGIIGCGNMGEAIANRLKEKYAVCVFDKDKNKISALKNIAAVGTSKELVEQSEIIILAVKPQDFGVMLNEIKPLAPDKLIISIAAGVTTRYLKSYLGEKARIIRVMPNMPAQINQGVSVLFKDNSIIEQEPDLAWQTTWQIFSYFGWELAVDKEEMINAATAVSGSGPAFFCYYIKEKVNADKGRSEFIKNLTQAAFNLGFDQREAEFISEKTVDGTIAMLRERNLSCADLIKMVASKGGTTQAGLDVLRLNGSLNDAINAAMKRANELEPG